MKIRLDDRFTLRSDEHNVWICENKWSERKASEEAYDGFHRSVTDCFESFYAKQQRLSEASSIAALRKDCHRAAEQIKSWCDVLSADLVSKSIQDAPAQRSKRTVALQQKGRKTK